MMNRRLAIFLAASFTLTWSAWGALVWLTHAGFLVYGQVAFMVLFIIGGLGPTIAAYVSVLATPVQAPLAEYNRRLLRWRVAGGWYAVALGLPAGLAIAAVAIGTLLRPELSGAISLRPWYMFVPLFGMMIVGGGLEELGWRGVAQEEIQRVTGPAKAALIVGLIWAVWHLPLFFLPGVSQSGANFPLFAIGVIGHALLLGWLYRRTASILLCILFHAAANAVAALGLTIPDQSGWLALTGPCLYLVLGLCLLTLARSPVPSVGSTL